MADQEYEYVETMGVGTSVIVTTEDTKYVGVVIDSDELYMYLNVSHKSDEVGAKVSPESSVALRKLLEAMSTWKLRLKLLVGYRILSLGVPRAEVLERLAQEMEATAIASYGTVTMLQAKPQNVNMAIPHMSIMYFESLTDVYSGSILSNLDFPVEEEYNGEHEQKD